MKVEFHKTGERRYAVKVLRENLSDLEMNPAPGFDPLMPHDLLHFLVEDEFKLRQGIFGQIASGGTAGTFQQKPDEKLDKRAASRLRRKMKKRGEKLLKTSGDDCDKSERATYICLYDWYSHSKDTELQKRAREIKSGVESTIAFLSDEEKSSFSKKKLAEIRKRIDEISERWSNLEVGQFISLDWKLD